MTPEAHKRYLDYRERHDYFGRRLEMLTMQQFTDAENELAHLAAQPERDDEDEARLRELSLVLLRD
jgi:hypothetical protein